MQRRLLTLLCVVPLVAFGGAYRWFTLTLIAMTALTLLVNVRAVLSAGRAQRALDISLIAGCALVAAQLLPLPPSLLQMLTPHAARLRGTLRLDSPFSSDAWQPLSTDPEATLHALAVAACATTAFFVARGVFATGGIRRWCRTLSWVGLAVSLAAVIQRATSPELIYGFWRPMDPNARPFGPFVNRNHFAAWLLMAGFVVAGYAVAHARIHIGSGPYRLRRVVRTVATAGTHVHVSAALLMAVTVVVTLSRSAMSGLIGGAVVLGLVARRRLRASRLSQLGFAAAAVMLAITLVSNFADLGGLATRVNDTMRAAPNARLVIWRESLPLLRDFWITGVGAGAYGSAMLLYERTDAFFHYNQAHSHYLQLAIEGGVVQAIPWLMAASLFLRQAKQAFAEDDSEIFFIRLGALCGVTAIAIQSVWETPLRMGANAILFAAVCAAAVHRRARR
jgi:putative inorganic carbon (hco3(-)) transporter